MQIYWHDGEGHVVIENVVTVAVLLPDEKKFNTSSRVTFRPRRRHHNKTFTCSGSVLSTP